MITYRSRFLARGEVWFDNEPDDTHGLDWILYQQRSRPVPGARTRYFYSFVIDLAQSCEQLQAQLIGDTAYKIRRARDRDKITCECHDPRDAAAMNQFEEMYNQFATMKGLRPLFRARMESMAAADLLELSVAKDSQGQALVYHANYRDRRRAAGLELPSLYRRSSDSKARNLSGRANRYLTWCDILRYKGQGLKYFDFGGWYHGTDPAMLKLNDFKRGDFKRGFGGQILREYQCEQIRTLKGWVVLQTAKLLKLARLFPSRSKKLQPNGPPELAAGQISLPAEGGANGA